ncbi:cytochrome P450 [Aaosphaeria arxii CBS 175.79]|uniref:Cytochrome P450 n=1 Tax=Aaosphaeria arxii CBS 175.79 TaxID=1450172 RepID=A0A6A5X7B3_9PLEO|nr:cytochrome P450 [Aaosphaeria arxii CBS 175.79]KAF2008812.1 cytochrome P450 [Aaosphaeria arxii CBS 175.79]
MSTILGAVQRLTSLTQNAEIQRAVLLSTFTISGGLVAYFIYNFIYNVFFHPYAKYPGPFLAKFTDLYAGYHAWKGDLHLEMWRLHEKYGEKVRYSPNKLNINNVTALKNIYTQGKPYLKSKNYAAMVHKATNTLTVRDRKDHGRRRRVIQQGLSDATLRAFEPHMYEIINRFCDRLIQTAEEEKALESQGLSTETAYKQHTWKEVRNMSEWCGYLAFDLMATFIFSGKYNMLEREQYRYVVKCIEESNIRVATILQAPSLKNFRLDKLLFPKGIIARNMFLNFVGKLLRDTKKVDRSQRKDLFEMLSHAKDPESGKGFSPNEIIAESVTLVVAGADTTATAMAAIFFYLSRNPNAYARAAEEVRSTFSSVEDIQGGAKLNSCRYLRACIDEAMRMSPSVGQTLAREVPAGGATVDGEFIPAGCDVGVPLYALHHNEKYYPDPFDYNPERWMVEKEGASQQVLDQYTAYNPFSVGPRSCMGKGVALVEMMATFAVVMFRLDFKIADSDVSGGKPGAEYGRHRTNEFQLNDHITASKNGPSLRFRPRVTA